MPTLFHHLLTLTAQNSAQRTALNYKNESLSYQQLTDLAHRFSHTIDNLDLPQGARVAIWLPKQPETVASFFATSMAGLVFVPLNPLLKPMQVSYVCKDCAADLLITSRSRWKQLAKQKGLRLPQRILLVDGRSEDLSATTQTHSKLMLWSNQSPSDATSTQALRERRLSTDIAAILYTSGSTGQPKGVVLSHQNLIYGARSVAQYLENTPDDRLLAVLPFSFDYGLSQLTTAFLTGASVALIEYLLPQDIVKAVVRYQITGLAAVPPLWHQIAGLKWPDGAADSVRYITNSGGHMPPSLLAELRNIFGKAKPYLMYGLTEAFRSSYLPPDEVDKRPDSIGKAIPNAELMVLNPQGEPCQPGEVGELVHRGPLVAMGYWNAPEKTAERFRPLPAQVAGIHQEIAVFSGDFVKTDEQGFLYFVGRRDEMIKSSGYRISPGEIESALLALADIKDVVALGVPHPTLGQAVVVVCASDRDEEALATELNDWCKRNLPGYMQPAHYVVLNELPKSNNGKIDRSRLKNQYSTLFETR